MRHCWGHIPLWTPSDTASLPPGPPEGQRGAGQPQGTHISQDLVGRSLVIDTLLDNETRIVVSWVGVQPCTNQSYFHSGGASGSGLLCGAGSWQHRG